MINLLQHDEVAVRRFGHTMLRDMHGEYESFEEVAQAACQYIFTGVTDENGRSCFALFRIYRLSRREDAPPSLAAEAASATDSVILMMGTQGIEPQWCRRQDSANHQLVNIDENLSPMFRAAFDRANIDPTMQTHYEQEDIDAFSGYFLVEQAVGCPAIPAQENFIKPYNIQSMITMGGRFLSGASYVAIGFSRQPMSKVAAARFSEISPHLSTLLAAYEGRGRLWSE